MVIRVISNIEIPLLDDFLIVYHFCFKKAIIISPFRVKLNREVSKMKEEKKEKIVIDPNGMYTGRPIDPDERPIQDADDL